LWAHRWKVGTRREMVVIQSEMEHIERGWAHRDKFGLWREEVGP
jgi:hypothetical protein